MSMVSFRLVTYPYASLLDIAQKLLELRLGHILPRTRQGEDPGGLCPCVLQADSEILHKIVQFNPQSPISNQQFLFFRHPRHSIHIGSPSTLLAAGGTQLRRTFCRFAIEPLASSGLKQLYRSQFEEILATVSVHNYAYSNTGVCTTRSGFRKPLIIA